MRILLPGWGERSGEGTQGGAQDVFFQDGGFGGHRTGGRVGTSEREATKDLCILRLKFRILTLFF